MKNLHGLRLSRANKATFLRFVSYISGEFQPMASVFMPEPRQLLYEQ